MQIIHQITPQPEIVHHGGKVPSCAFTKGSVRMKTTDKILISNVHYIQDPDQAGCLFSAEHYSEDVISRDILSTLKFLGGLEVSR